VTRARTVAGAAALGIWILTAHGPLTAQNPLPTFRASADSVRVDVSVRQRGRPVTGLTAGDFELLDNGVPQAIADLSYEKLPIDVTVALDVSESVTGAILDQLRRSVRELQQDLTPRDRLRLLTFNLRITRLLDFGAPASAWDAALEHIRPFGGTSVRDTMAVVLSEAASEDRRHLVVVFSDGNDSQSLSEPAVLLEVVRRTTPTLCIVLASSRGSMPPSATEVVQRQLYAQLARETGGILDSLGASDNLGSAFRRMLDEYRTSYVLHFVPRGVTPSGFHAVDVHVTRPGADVRARRGYTWN
jgi:VWFA-related protein